jgi:asparagine synthase (glutamine-hydrolysing)
MCGVCGFVGAADDALARSMADVIAHRGPDDHGVRSFAADGRLPASLGHRRLAIIDPDPRSAQPMPYADDRYWLTYNGELYNYRELREGLRRDGFTFRTESDSEVLLAMYARDGAGALPQLNGIFAFAIWDAERGELFMARDRLGVKPLYYAFSGDVLYFASEVKSLLRAIPPPAVRSDAIADYLTFLWVADPDTIFDGVSKLPPGHWASYSREGLAVHQYWDVSFAPERGSADEWAAELQSTVRGAVRRQMVSDVPLGGFLSGGVDSSAIVAEMSSVRSNVSTYTVGFSAADLGHEPISDDLKYAREIGATFPVDYHEQILEADLVDLLPRLIWHLDEPIADPACITTYLICSTARQELTVILSGMGGDEVFAGYYRHLAAQLGRAADLIPRRARSAFAHLVDEHVTLGRPGRLRKPRRNLRKLAEGIDADARERYLTYLSYYRPAELSAVLSSDLRAELNGHDPFRKHRAFFDKVANEHWLNQLLYVDQKTFLPCLNLSYTDKMSMAASTEVRVPLLDDEVIELAGRIPPQLKLQRLTRKHIFRKSMEGVLPREVIHRPKAGFGAPLRAWLAGPLKPMVRDLLSPEQIARRGLLDPDEVQRIIRVNEEGGADYALRVWAFLTLELWHRTFVDGAMP